MFGHTDDNQTVMGSPTVQNPSMLDNVSSTDFQSNSDDAATSAPTSQPAQMPPDVHQMTTDNPFVQTPAATTTTTDTSNPMTTPPAQQAYTPQPDPTFTPMPDNPPAVTTQSSSPSAPVPPPVAASDVPQGSTDQSGYLAALTQDDSTAQPVVEPVDKDKLADMKQQALAHLEPLAEHLDGTPEETFKTTMMMIQANDNHHLLEKALDAAKKIDDDKIRAQAMLDIINEINYFSQQQ